MRFPTTTPTAYPVGRVVREHGALAVVAGRKVDRAGRHHVTLIDDAPLLRWLLRTVGAA